MIIITKEMKTSQRKQFPHGVKVGLLPATVEPGEAYLPRTTPRKATQNWLAKSTFTLATSGH